MTYPEKASSLVDTRIISFGNNLEQLKKLPDKCIDLVYIDPPFDSNRTYKEFWKELEAKLVFKDCPESTQAYLDFMRPRCVELARVLKPTGSFYYHCDWDAKHYVEVMLDQVLGKDNFINEIIWKRQSDHNDATQGSKRLGRVHGTLLLYSGDSKCYYAHLYRPYDEDYVEKLYMNVEPETGRRYRLGDLVAPGEAAPSNGKPQYEFLGVRGSWRYSKVNMQKLYKEGRIDQTKLGAKPHFKRYLDEIAGVPVGSVWDNIKPIQSHDEERFGYPTQEPLKLLERILEIALQVNDADLDACGGCGTALVAALDSGRQWIGIGHFTNVLPHQEKLGSVGDSAAAAQKPQLCQS
jgi:adenine-specific DNA-methyltransferase